MKGLFKTFGYGAATITGVGVLVALFYYFVQLLRWVADNCKWLIFAVLITIMVYLVGKLVEEVIRDHGKVH